MMKTVLIVIGVLGVIVVAAHYADKATRLPHTSVPPTKMSAAAKDAAQPEPDLTLKDLDGKDVSLAQYNTRAEVDYFLEKLVTLSL